MRFRPWFSQPSHIIMSGAGRPGTVKTIEQAVEFHRKALTAAAVISNPSLRSAHEFGLANALWEMETPAHVAEACELGWRVVESSGGEDSVATFLLDLLLESGDWEGAVRLLAKFKARKNDAWLWCTPLVYFKTRGDSSRVAREAATAAMEANPFIAPRLFQEEESKQVHQSFQEQMMGVVRGQHHMLEVEAQQFFKNFGERRALFLAMSSHSHRH